MEQLNDTNFQSVVIDSGKKVLVDFSAEWCGPCRMVEPVLEEMSKSHKDVEFKRVNIDDYEDLAQQYGVKALVMGYDHHFGHDSGTYEEYEEWGREVGVEVLKAREMKKEKISSLVLILLLKYIIKL